MSFGLAAGRMLASGNPCWLLVLVELGDKARSFFMLLEPHYVMPGRTHEVIPASLMVIP